MTKLLAMGHPLNVYSILNNYTMLIILQCDTVRYVDVRTGVKRQLVCTSAQGGNYCGCHKHQKYERGKHSKELKKTGKGFKSTKNTTELQKQGLVSVL